jgi:protein-disulfide isomerase
MNKKIFLVNFLFIAAIIIIIATAWGLCKKEKEPTVSSLPQILETDPKKGENSAKVTIVEFGDFQCPYCKKMYEVFNQVREAYGEKVRFVWKDFPLVSIHDQALAAAEAGRCAQMQGKFWQMHDLLFENQDGLSESLYISLASELGLDQTAFSKCLSDHETTDLINQNISEGQSLGIMSTPYFYINNIVGEEVIYFDDLKKIIDSQL